MAKESFLTRHTTGILLVAVLLAPVAGWGALRAIGSNRNDVSDWLPKNYPETLELNWFRANFVADQFIIASWEGCDLGDDPTGAQDDAHIAKLADALLKVRLPQKVGKDLPAFKDVTTAREVLLELTSEPTSLSQKQARERLSGSLIGPDGKQTCVMATLTPEASANLKLSIARPMKRIFRTSPTTPLFEAIAIAGLDPEIVRLGGPPIDNTAIDQEGERTLMRLAGLSAALGIGLAYYSLRSVRMTAIVFTCGVYSAALALAAVPFTGGSMDAVLMSMPALIYVLAVSGAVHIINYYRQAVAEHGSVEHAAEHAIVHAWRPALLTSVTTAIGLASLLTSDIIPIAKFGGYSALGVWLLLGVLFGVLPACLKKWPWVPPELAKLGVSKHTTAPQVEGMTLGQSRWNAYGNFVRRRHAAVLTASLLTIALLCTGLPRVTTSIDLLKLFSKDARLIKDYEWFEAHLGPIVPMEIVIRVPKKVHFEDAPPGQTPGQLVDRLRFVERLDLIGRIEQGIKTRLGPQGDKLVGGTMSAATFAPKSWTSSTGSLTAGVRSFENKQLELHRAEFERAGYLRQEKPTKDKPDGDELWRISVRVAAFHNLDHGVLVDRIRQSVEPVLTARKASVVALKSLAQRRHGPPNGADVIVWNVGDQAVTNDIDAFLTTKNVRASKISTPVAKISDEQLASIAQKYDGVVIGPGVDARDVQRVRLAGVPVLATFDGANLATAELRNMSAVYTGVIPVVYKAQRALLDSLIQSTWWSFATITPLMMWVCRGVAAGAVVMIPNALPVLVVFGGMGWLGIPVDIGSMMAASIALGVAVDDTIHFLAWFKDDLRALGDRNEAILSAYRRSATATLQAALINGLGLSVFATSSFTPTQRFGWLMLTILVAGVISELVMLPALMFGPIGKVFGVGRKDVAATPVPGRVDAPAAVLDHRHALREHGASLNH